MLTLNPTFDFSILIPTRKRTKLLHRAINSILDTKSSETTIEFVLGIDDDDIDTQEYLREVLVKELQEKNIVLRAYISPRAGYNKLHTYFNNLGFHSMGRWMLLCSDDSLMLDKNWDLEIKKWDGQFKLLRFKENHNDHPYALFPCLPRDWIMLFEKFSEATQIDGWISQICYLNDIVQNLESRMYHDRYDITGNNFDEVVQDKLSTFKEQGKDENPSNPLDVNHPDNVRIRMQWAAKLNWYLKQIGQGTDWFDRFIFDKSFDVWSKFKEADKNNQCWVR